MLSKFRLDRRNKYESRLFAQKLAEMIVGVVNSVPHASEIGSEQGGIPHWDDIVEVRCDGTIAHTQVKRQSESFSTYPPVRPSTDAKTSALDDALESLATSIDRHDLDAPGKRFFELIVFGPGVLVKRGIRVEKFSEIVDICSTESFSCQKMEQRDDSTARDVFQWLTTWCGFRDWAHIQSALSRLRVTFGGTEEQIDGKILASLASVFTDPHTARESLLSYAFDEASDVGAISRRALMQRLKHLLRPDIASWTQYLKVDGFSRWELSGIHDLESQDAERAAGIVTRLWSNGGERRVLQFQAPLTSIDVGKISLPHAILRLALHLSGGAQCLLEDVGAWKAKASDLAGQTMGHSASDLRDLPWAESQPRPGPAMRSLDGVGPSNSEASSLMQAMDMQVLGQLAKCVNDSLERVMDEALQAELAALWNEWHTGLADDPAELRSLFASMLHPATEGLAHGSLLRVGPRALDLLDNAIMTLLVVAVSIGGKGSTWSHFTDCGAVLSIALKQWSGPVGSQSGRRHLESDDLHDIIGPKPNAVVVLSGIDSPADSILQPTLSGAPYDETSFMAQRRPKVLVTGHRIDRFLRKGKLEDVRMHFRSQWDAQISARNQAIENATDGKQ
ncbi:ABC-three component system protein [uncultured Stenotrophomonas sp.]|uniref:ABC-three component system protein n=1 Tax=uncultured Stenotrophomonas sp. TaxID=165438 RepID=UPI0025FEB0E8|nr:ABC-three component system protein [uncultured Stenotrophomonas sp.]